MVKDIATSTPYLDGALLATVQLVAAGNVVMDSYYIFNPDSAVAYIQLFDCATAAGVTLGTTTPVWSIPVPAGAAANLAGLALEFKLGLCIAATTTYKNSTPAGTANIVNIGYYL